MLWTMVPEQLMLLYMGVCGESVPCEVEGSQGTGAAEVTVLVPGTGAAIVRGRTPVGIDQYVRSRRWYRY